MQSNRPLSEVPTRALYALHRGIERQDGLIERTYTDDCGGRCALASLGVRHKYWKKDIARKCSEIGLPTYVRGRWVDFDLRAMSISSLNSLCKGTPEERREFMLRHIVNELLARGESLPVTTSEDVSELEPVCP